MTVVRYPTANSKYYIDKHTFQIVLHFCYKYKEWKEEYFNSTDNLKAVSSGEQTIPTGHSDGTANLGIRLSEIKSRIDLIENTAKEVAPDIFDHFLLGITTEGMTYHQLSILGVPCSHNYYYAKRREFYFKISQRIEL